MPHQTSYSYARKHLAKLIDQVAEDREVVIITRRNRENVAMIAQSELVNLLETVHLLRSPRNAQRLLESIESARAEEGEVISIDELRKEIDRTTEQ